MPSFSIKQFFNNVTFLVGLSSNNVILSSNSKHKCQRIYEYLSIISIQKNENVTLFD